MTEEYVDVIKDGEIITMPLSQANKEDLFVLRKKMAAPAPPATPPILLRQPSRSRAQEELTRPLSRWHSYQPEYKKNNVGKDLVDNFHWEIAKARKSRNLSRRQLGEAIGEPEANIKMIENGELPSDDFILINRIQSYLGINLRKDGKTFDTAVPVSQKPSYKDNVTLSDLQKMKESEKKASSDIEIID